MIYIFLSGCLATFWALFAGLIGLALFGGCPLWVLGLVWIFVFCFIGVICYKLRQGNIWHYK
jgi:hypothetical protein